MHGVGLVPVLQTNLLDSWQEIPIPAHTMRMLFVESRGPSVAAGGGNNMTVKKLSCMIFETVPCVT